MYNEKTRISYGYLHFISYFCPETLIKHNYIYAKDPLYNGL